MTFVSWVLACWIAISALASAIAVCLLRGGAREDREETMADPAAPAFDG